MTDQTLTVTLDPRPTAPTVLRIAGELDHHTTPRVREVLDTVPLAPDAGLVIDLTDLAYCDSTGITVLITAYQRAQAAGSPFGLAGLSRELTRVFQIIGLDKVFPFHPTVDEAIDAQRP
ncbi:STAS domain-containing protein [Saccharothrix lopnurensis]|uniref:Anti-sigma factor antagonist n=1 Tax=Saccharothrix lopnurensis TaxID=1670621 RepID=A0ABW1NXK4_9PSEU